MLDQAFGGLRPWEMDGFTPAEEAMIYRYRDQLAAQAEGV